MYNIYTLILYILYNIYTFFTIPLAQKSFFFLAQTQHERR